MSKSSKYLDIKPSNNRISESSNNVSVSSFNVSALKEIPKLLSGNLVSWKQGLKIHLKMNGLFGFIEREQHRPTSVPECDAFDMRQAAVLHAIRSTIDDVNRASIDSMDNPKIAYDALVVQHGSDDGFTAANTLTELFSTTYNPASSMNKYLAKIQDLHSRVQDLTSNNPDLKISNKLFAVVLVNSLPRLTYGTVVQQLLANIKTLTMSQVTACLRLEAVQWPPMRHVSKMYTLPNYRSTTPNSNRAQNPTICVTFTQMGATPTPLAFNRRQRPLPALPTLTTCQTKK